MDFYVMILMLGLSLGFLLFLLSSGLTLTMGLMNVLNMAHGGFYLIGSYVGLSVYTATQSFWLAILAGAAVTGAIGVFMERGFLRYMPGYKHALDQVFLTFGFLYIFINVAQWIWKAEPLMASPPSVVAGSLQIGAYFFPIYRLVIIFAGIVIAAGLWWFQEKTRFGAIIRAGIDNPEMIMGLGINLRLVFTLVFSMGVAVAGIAGVIGLPFIGAYLESGWDILLYAVIVVIIGGMGSLQGALVGSLLIGIIISAGKVFLPAFASLTIYILVIIIILTRPSGILGKRS